MTKGKLASAGRAGLRRVAGPVAYPISRIGRYLLNKASTMRELDASHDVAWVRNWLTQHDIDKSIGRP